MSNHLKGQTSPYLLQHTENPVDWYPWCEQAFERARREDKPVFLSIGYSTCHWCHVMAHESFENTEIADILNRSFIAIKVDKEERPDIDSIYMAACQAFTGSGGWPTSIFMTAEQKPFFAGTYFPAAARFGTIGFKDLLKLICDKWQNDRQALLARAEEMTDILNRTETTRGEADEGLIASAVALYKNSFDKKHGGFGEAPKFPAAHNLLFLLTHYEKSGDKKCLEMAEKTLRQMYLGGIFDHIGYGFCRYSTDKYFLAPHFEKMLDDNALLIIAYCKAHSVTGNSFYLQVAEKTALFVLREMTSPEGAFYSALDADSNGEQGRFYLFEPSEIIAVLGEEAGEEFNRCYDITQRGNFDGRSIPNLLRTQQPPQSLEEHLPRLFDYRRRRNKLHTDDKILTRWNSLMISAMCRLYRASRNEKYLCASLRAQSFIEKNLCEGDALFVSFRSGRRSEKGFLEDYANYISALLSLYDATLKVEYLQRAKQLLQRAVTDFYDRENGGFYLYGKEHHALISRPKESYDGAAPSGNSVMAYNLMKLFYLEGEGEAEKVLRAQLDFIAAEAQRYPAGYAMFLTALSHYLDMPTKIVAVVKNHGDLSELPFAAPPESIIKILDKPTAEYPLKNDEATYYVCEKNSCLPPVNSLAGAFGGK